ncbi:flavoprotein [Embleya hyalina]|uniref:Flavoprotein n=1 Tax=Embleya hyalina TaxID=516124 RepID=A0A401YF95_9ACTN|nr:flavoprotein [Embleya hyalina]GCD93281.1 flavoprotein [Embleya hyalina]
MSGVLYLVVCAAGPAPGVVTLVRDAVGRGWDVCTIATPAAEGGGFVDVAAVEGASGRVVRHRYRRADEAVAVAPMTVNTLTKWADGHADTYALGVLTEALGLRLPIAALPFWNAAQAAHPAVDRAVATLRSCGVQVLYGEPHFVPHLPGTGGTRIPAHPWHLVLDALAGHATEG